MLLRLVRATPTCCWSRSGPACWTGSGSATSACARRTRGLVYCAITGYGQDGPNRDRSGHDMNYLGLNGLLGLTGEADGPPVQAAGQIADIGGGALMAAVGILVALRERERSGEGQLVDCSMFDGALSWLAHGGGRGVRHRAGAARAASCALAGRFNCYRPYECADGYVDARRAGAEVLAGLVRRRRARPTCSSTPSTRRARSRTRRWPRSSAQRTREQWRAFASEHDCCLEPVLELDEALDSELVARAGDGRRAGPAGRRSGRSSCWGCRSSSAARPATRAARPGPALGEHTDEVLAAAGFAADEIAALHEAGAVAGAGERRAGLVPRS